MFKKIVLPEKNFFTLRLFFLERPVYAAFVRAERLLRNFFFLTFWVTSYGCDK